MTESPSKQSKADPDRAVAPPHVPGRIPSLDGLRAISIALVFLGHIVATRGAPQALNPFIHVGNLGVKVFFVISGFLITTLLLKEYSRTGRVSLRGFYTRRTLRIFPAFYTYVGIIIILHLLGFVALRENDLIHAITYTMNYQVTREWELNHLWSLAVEEQFYLL